MSTAGYRTLCSLSLAGLLLFVPVMTATAAGPLAATAEGSFQLDRAQMKEALSLEDFDLYSHEAAPAAGLTPEVADLAAANEAARPAAPQDLFRRESGNFALLAQAVPQQTSAVQAAPATKDKKSGSWLKRHWWVPVLAAAAVGVAVAGGGDSDAGGEDD